MLQGDVPFGARVRVANVRVANASRAATAPGDWTATVAAGDFLDFSASPRKQLQDFGYFGFYSEFLYGATPASFGPCLWGRCPLPLPLPAMRGRATLSWPMSPHMVRDVPINRLRNKS